MVANESRRRRFRLRRAGATRPGRWWTDWFPFQNIDIHPFDDPADFESPVALRPRLATGVLFRGGRPDERSQPRVHVVGCLRRIRFAFRSGNRPWVRGRTAKGLRETGPDLPARPPFRPKDCVQLPLQAREWCADVSPFGGVAGSTSKTHGGFVERIGDGMDEDWGRLRIDDRARRRRPSCCDCRGGRVHTRRRRTLTSRFAETCLRSATSRSEPPQPG